MCSGERDLALTFVDPARLAIDYLRMQYVLSRNNRNAIGHAERHKTLRTSDVLECRIGALFGVIHNPLAAFGGQPKTGVDDEILPACVGPAQLLILNPNC